MTNLVIYGYMHKARSQQLLGFTIVELLVVIVVIGILAAITIVSYTGISKQATIASLQSDLTNAAKQLKMFKVENGMYPATFSVDCAAQPTATTNICLKASPGSTYTDYQVDNPSNPQSFTLTEMKSNIFYSIADDGSPAFLASAPYWKQIETGTYHTCAIAFDGRAYCWGWNNSGRLGNGLAVDSSVAVAVANGALPASKTLKSISANSNHTCAIASDNQAYCWGSNTYGSLGDSSTTSRSVPVAVSTVGILSSKTLKSIATGERHTCVIASDNQAYCWGDNTYGQLGNNSTTQSLVPVAVSISGVLSGKTLKSIDADAYHTCVIDTDNQAYCWGYNTYGQLGNDSTTQSLVPVAVSTSGVLSGKTLKSINAGVFHTCSIASDDQAYCWGRNTYGQLGNDSTTQSLVPVAVSTSGVLSGKTIMSISAGQYYACAIVSDNQAYCWGSSGNGQLGNDSTTQSLVPVAVSTSGVLSGKTIMSISAGQYYACVMSSDNQAYCWGYNLNGQFGDNSTTNSLVPVAVIPLGS
ncbi:MAG: prepilin-type N-terminal cleavage/methylation domain-containing protein [Actinomycetota bacterium]|nr:prepilin-type N-terminal cleavage/methylation domain-containing protein [Actinomycetota bacterium]